MTDEDSDDRPRDLSIRPMDRETALSIPASSAIGGVRIENFLQLLEVANLMARSGPAVRKFARGQVGTCFALATQALEWNMSPFAVASKAYEVNDQIAYEAQLVAALVITRAPILGEPDYSYEGTGGDLKCTVTCQMKSGKTLSYTSPRLAQISPRKSPLWVSDPEQQLGYYSIRAWARRHAPNVLLGVYTPEELELVGSSEMAKDVTPGNSLVERLKAAPTPAAGFDAQAIEKTLAPEPVLSQTEVPTREPAELPENGVSSSPDAVAATEDNGPPLPSSSVAAVPPSEPVDGSELPSFVWASVRLLATEGEVEAFWRKWRRKSAALPNRTDALVAEAGKLVNERLYELRSQKPDA